MTAIYPSLHGRGALITGGAAGIGAGLVEAFLRQGARVAFLDVDAGGAAALIASCRDLGLPAPLFLRCDIADVPALRAAVAEAAAQIGPIRTLVNNAARDDRMPLDALTPEHWDASQAVNLRPHVFAAQAAAPLMAQAGGGAIVNMSSNSALLGLPGMPAYVTAKAAILGLTRALAAELGPQNIRVNAVLPGWVMTERQRRLWATAEAERELLQQQSIKRTMSAADVTGLVLFLASDDAAMITKQLFVADGGRA